MPDLALVVAGRRYGGWKSVRVTRSIESVAGSFDLTVSDRWAGQGEAWRILEEDACKVTIDDEVVIDGYVDRRSIAVSAEDRTLTYSGRDRTAALADCSAELEAWTFRRASMAEVARKICEPFGIAVSVQPGLSLGKPPPKLVVAPGDGALEVLVRAAKEAGVLLVGDGAAGLLITRAGTERAAPLVLGENLLAAAVEYNGADRFRRYVVGAQAAATDEAFGETVAGVSGVAVDEGVRRTERVLRIPREGGESVASARRRADWEARIRAARAETVSVAVRGWQQPGGGIWPVNALSRVVAHAIGINGDMLISEAEFSVDGQGERTQLRLVRPDAFTPEPKAVVGGSGRWKELDPAKGNADAFVQAGATLARGILGSLGGGGS